MEASGQGIGTMKSFEDVLAYLAQSWAEDTPREPFTDEQAENHARWQCSIYNEQEGNLAGDDCRECKNKGYVMRPTGGWDTAMYECACMKKRRYLQGLKRAGLTGADRLTFEAYETEEEWQAKAKRLAMQYADNPGGRWLFVAGNSGAGKTHLCTAVCSQLLKEGREIRYEIWSEILHGLEQKRFDERGYEERMESLRTVDVLYIDDFLKTPANKRPSDSALSYALEIINGRYVSGRITILSTEYLLDELAAFDEALAGRIAERSKGSKIQMRGENRNYRMRK